MPWYTFNCKTCGKRKTAWRSKTQKPPIYCSKECHYQTKIIICKVCGKEVKIKKGRFDIFTCGGECRKEYHRLKHRRKLGKQLGEPIKDALRRLYIKERKSYREICRLWNINVRTLMKIMDECDIQPRKGSEAIKTQWEGNDERKEQFARQTSERMRAYFANGGESPSKRPDVRRKISKAKKRNNWMKGRTGSKHHNWQGGKIWWRGKEWDDLKEEIRKRDDYRCQRCGMTDDECIDTFGAPLQVHHIVPYRLSHDNSPENLKTLCNKCHSQADHEFYWLL